LQTRQSATLIGGLAVLMWACLAPLTTAALGIPSLQLLAMTFGVAFVCGVVWLLVAGGPSRLARLRQPPGFWVLAVAGLFGYHVLYFVALRLAPPAQASLVAYLWPLLIVLFSCLGAGGEKLRATHVLGAVLGLGGTALLILSNDSADAASINRPLGLLAALGCALIWSSYSVLNRRFAAVPSDAMVGVCGVVSLLGFAAYWISAGDLTAPSITQMLAILALGIGPTGLAFLAWDHGTKHGDLPLLGVLSFAAPVLSTLLLVMLGRAAPTLTLLIACTLVVGGAALATLRINRPSRLESTP